MQVAKKEPALRPIRTRVKVENRNDLVQENDDYDYLSPTSRMFHEPNYNIYVIAIMGWKTKVVDLEVVKDNLVHTLLKHPRFSSLQFTDDHGNIKWIPKQVDLDNHIIVPNIDPSTKSPDKFVEDYISNISNTDIDKSQPLWELHILNIKTSDAEAVSVFRIHHSLGDGVALISNLLACTRKTSDPESLPTFPAPKRRVLRKKNVLWECVVKLWLLIQLVVNTVVDFLRFVATAMFLKDSDTPVRGSGGGNGVVRHRFVYRTVSLDDAKLVKNAMNGTINDVVLGVTQAGLARYLNRKFSEETNERERESILENLRFRATVLMNLRPDFGLQASKEMIENDSFTRQGNCFGMVLVPLAIGRFDDPLEYVRRAKAIMNRKKKSLEVYCSAYIFKFVLSLFGYKIAAALSSRVPSQTSLGFSNVAGPLEEISFYGHPMAYLAATCYGQPHGLMIHVVSYANKLTFTLSVDERNIPDSSQLVDDIVESFELIRDAVISREKPKSY